MSRYQFVSGESSILPVGETYNPSVHLRGRLRIEECVGEARALHGEVESWRSRFGRAGLPLLRKRVLLTAQNQPAARAVSITK
jgi:hypothetical protein